MLTDFFLFIWLSIILKVLYYRQAAQLIQVYIVKYKRFVNHGVLEF
jgi:hypothetical protein